MSSTLTVAVDVDEVCADLLSEWSRRYNRDYNDSLTLDQITEWDLTKLVKPECGKDIYKYLRQPDLYEHVMPYPDALGAVNYLRGFGHRVVFATSCVRGSYDAKVNWLAEWGFIPNWEHVPKDVYPCGDKSLIMADVLVDDGIHNLDAFPRWRVLITRPHNALIAPTRPHWRVNNLMDAAERIHKHLGRVVEYADT